RPVVGILADDHHLDLLQRRRIERVEDLRAGGIDDPAGGLFRNQELPQLLHVGLFELIAEGLLPVLCQLHQPTHGLVGAAGTAWALQRSTRWRPSTSRPDRPLCRVACRIITPSTHSATSSAGRACSWPASLEPRVTR